MVKTVSEHSESAAMKSGMLNEGTVSADTWSRQQDHGLVCRDVGNAQLADLSVSTFIKHDNRDLPKKYPA